MLEGKTIVIIGHPLAAEENRLPFRYFQGAQIHLIVPERWKARSAGREFRFDAGSGGGEPSHPYQSHSLPVLFSGSNTFFSWRGLWPLLDRLRPDLIYGWEEAWCLASWQVLRFCRTHSIPLLFYAAENRKKRLPWPISTLCRKVLAGTCAALAVSEEASLRLRELGFTRRIFTIPLPIRAYPSILASRDNRLLLYIGRLIPLKRVDLLVKTLPHLKQWRLRIIGDGPEKKYLHDLSLQLGVVERVEFLGHVPNRQLAAVSEGATFACIPTGENPWQAEQFGKSALEAVAFGLPVLVSAGGHFVKIANEFETLYAQAWRNEEELARSIEYSWDNYPSQAQLALSRERVISRYGSEAVGRLMADAFASILTGEK